jgi:urease accessory protein UreE
MVLVMPGKRLDRINSGQRHSKGELENNSRKPRDLTLKRHSNGLKKSQLSLSQGILKKGDVVVIADDDDIKVRTSVSQNCVKATL